MSRNLKIVASIIVVGSIVVAIFPPFLLPEFLYNSIYGWRYPKNWQCGDGTISDIGPNAAIDRYTIMLDEFLLSESADRQYKLCDLPEVTFVACLKLRNSDVPNWEKEWRVNESPSVKIQINDLDGNRTIEKAGVLSLDWTWSGSPALEHMFIYGRDSTYFDPIDSHSYNIRIKIEPTSDSPPVKAQFVVLGGGWK